MQEQPQLVVVACVQDVRSAARCVFVGPAVASSPPTAGAALHGEALRASTSRSPGIGGSWAARGRERISSSIPRMDFSSLSRSTSGAEFNRADENLCCVSSGKSGRCADCGAEVLIWLVLLQTTQLTEPLRFGCAAVARATVTANHGVVAIVDPVLTVSCYHGRRLISHKRHP